VGEGGREAGRTMKPSVCFFLLRKRNPRGRDPLSLVDGDNFYSSCSRNTMVGRFIGYLTWQVDSCS
jgi:hypothetical protein